MKSETAKQLIQSTAALICVVSFCVTASISSDKIVNTIKETASSPSSSGGGFNSSIDNPVFGNDAAVDTGINTDASGDMSGTGQTTPDNSGSSSAGNPSDAKPAGSSASSAQSTAKDNESKKMTKAEIINYCNTALNKAKAAKIGYNKKMVREAKGSTDGISPKLLKLVAADKSTTMKKGSDDIIDDFPAAGFSWSSKLREQDVATATISQNGNYYEIKLTLGKENNPAKGEASSYGRVMSVIDAAEAGKMVPGIKSINMNYHNGYVYAKVDSKTGKLVAAEFSAAADIQADIKIFGSVSVKDIVSTETFTNIVW